MAGNYSYSYSGGATPSSSRNTSGGSTVSGGQTTTSGQTSSSGAPVAVQTPQSSWELAISNADQALADQQYQWGVNQYANTSAMTDASVNNYLSQAQSGANLASQQLNQYQNIYEPENAQLASDAGTYSSAARQAQNAGMAESATSQASDAGRINAENTLQSYGIDPSSGMYGELENAQRAGASATAAGAGQQADLATANTGRALLGQSIAVGEQQPGDVVNALNSAYQGVAGAQNAVQQNANTGVNLQAAGNANLSTAMAMKLPPVGQQTSSSGSNNSESTNQSQSGNSSSGISTGSTPNTSTSSSYPSNGSSSSPSSGGGNGNYGGGGGYTPPSSAPDNFGPAAQGTYPFGAAPQGGGGGTYGGGSYGGGSYGYAKGGTVRPRQGIPSGPTTGGQVPGSASPSGGKQTDDVKANLNAGEFVVPRDVVHDKGHEFFRKLIASSRKNRLGMAGAPPQGKMGPSQPGPVRFQSRPVGNPQSRIGMPPRRLIPHKPVIPGRMAIPMPSQGAPPPSPMPPPAPSPAGIPMGIQ